MVATTAERTTGRRQTQHTKRPRQAGSRHIDDPREQFSDDEWHDMVATAAYFRAEARGFKDGSADEDWYEADE